MLYHILVLFMVPLITGCATPIGPTGGPGDQLPPKVLSTEPETGTTNYEGNSITFYFDEFVNRNSVSGNITIEPDLGLEYSLDWRRKDLTVKFEDELPDSTTVILTLGSEISDTRSNKLGKPIQVAFSTGDEIDQGSVTGKIRDAKDGSGVENATVLLYRQPIDITQPATYKAQTDTGGNFQFGYLRQGIYQAIYLEDRNRNKVWEEGSEAAQPFQTERIELAKADTTSLEPLYVVQTDSLAPKLLGVGMFSSSRLRFRFDDNITMTDSASIQVLDTLGNLYSEAIPLYISQDDPFVLFGYSLQATGQSEFYETTMNGVSDESGNAVITSGVRFQGSEQQDTTLQRIISEEGTDGLFPDQSFKVTYATLINDPMITDSLVVVEGDVTFDDWPDVRVVGNELFVDPQEETWIEGVDYQFLIWDPLQQRRKLYTPEVWDFSELGELEVRIEGGDSTKVYTVELRSEEISYSFREDFNQLLTIDELAPVRYTVVVFEDVNGNGEWDKGSLSPFRAPEPYFVRDNISIKAGFASEVIITF